LGFTEPARSPGLLVVSYTTVSPLPVPPFPLYPRDQWVSGLVAIGGLLSVALSVGSPRLGVTQQPALWSSDFPQASTAKACDHLTNSDAPDSDGEGRVSLLQYKMR
jgi:hypothetical protein